MMGAYRIALAAGGSGAPDADLLKKFKAAMADDAVLGIANHVGPRARGPQHGQDAGIKRGGDDAFVSTVRVAAGDVNGDGLFCQLAFPQSN